MLKLQIYKNEDIVSNKTLKNFCLYLKDMLSDLMLSNTDWQKISYINTFVKDGNLTNDVYTCLKYGLVLKEGDDCYYICFNNNAKLNIGSPESIIRFITFGTLDFKGYTIYSELFEEVSLMIGRLFREWLLNGD